MVQVNYSRKVTVNKSCALSQSKDFAKSKNPATTNLHASIALCQESTTYIIAHPEWNDMVKSQTDTVKIVKSMKLCNWS